MLSSPSGYQDLIDKYGLGLWVRAPDISLDATGNLAMTTDGNIQFGSVASDALHQLVINWRLNAPVMRMLFDANTDLRSRKDEFEDCTTVVIASGQRIASRAQDLSAYDKAQGEKHSARLGQWTLAGSLMIAAASLLGKFKSEAGASDGEWSKAQLLCGDVSIGQAIVSAANFFRHRDEYVKARYAGTVGTRQRNNTAVLLSALSLADEQDLFGDQSPSERLALLLGGEQFDEFEGAVLRYANAVAEKAETRSAGSV